MPGLDSSLSSLLLHAEQADDLLRGLEPTPSSRQTNLRERPIGFHVDQSPQNVHTLLTCLAYLPEGSISRILSIPVLRSRLTMSAGNAIDPANTSQTETAHHLCSLASGVQTDLAERQFEVQVEHVSQNMDVLGATSGCRTGDPGA